jgi:hypothetical protein
MQRKRRSKPPSNMRSKNKRSKNCLSVKDESYGYGEDQGIDSFYR